jgi:hypothetical protein
MWMPLLLVLLAVGLMANALLGPLGLGWIEWRLSPLGLNQTYGIDAVAFVLGAPLALGAAWLWRSGARLAAPLALGSALFALYYGVAEVIGPDYVRYAGNNERWFLLCLAVIVLSWTIALRAWSALDPSPPAPPVWLGRSLAVVLGLGGALLIVAWGAQVLDIAITGRLSEAYLDAPSGFWIVRVVDLGFLAPACVATAIGLWRGSAVALKAAYGLTTFLTLQAVAVLAMAAVMLVRGDPTATPEFALGLLPICLGLGGLTTRLLMTYRAGVSDDAVFGVRVEQVGAVQAGGDPHSSADGRLVTGVGARH